MDNTYALIKGRKLVSVDTNLEEIEKYFELIAHYQDLGQYKIYKEYTCKNSPSD